MRNGTKTTVVEIQTGTANPDEHEMIVLVKI
jgi:hypothetical protein